MFLILFISLSRALFENKLKNQAVLLIRINVLFHNIIVAHSTPEK